MAKTPESVRMAQWDEEEEYWFHKGEMNREPLLIENTAHYLKMKEWQKSQKVQGSQELTK